MKYIRSCSECGTELRFPLDRGILIVKCPRCNSSFVIDPDNPDTYKQGRFDYPKDNPEPSQNSKNKFSSFLESTFTTENSASIKKILPILLFLLLAIHLVHLFFTSYNENPNQNKIKEKPPIHNHPPTKEPEFEI